MRFIDNVLSWNSQLKKKIHFIMLCTFKQDFKCLGNVFALLEEPTPQVNQFFRFRNEPIRPITPAAGVPGLTRELS